MCVLFLYLWYNHIISVSNDCVGVVGRVYWDCLSDIVARAILVWLLGWR